MIIPFISIVSFNVKVPEPEIAPKIEVLPLDVIEPLFVIVPNSAFLEVTITPVSLLVNAFITKLLIDVIEPELRPVLIVNVLSFWTVAPATLFNLSTKTSPCAVNLPTLSKVLIVALSTTDIIPVDEFSTYSINVVPETFSFEVLVKDELIDDEIIIILSLFTTLFLTCPRPASTKTLFNVTKPIVFWIALVLFAKITLVIFAIAPSLFNVKTFLAFWIVKSLTFILVTFTRLNPVCLSCAWISLLSVLIRVSSWFTFVVKAPPKSITAYLASSFV